MPEPRLALTTGHEFRYLAGAAFGPAAGYWGGDETVNGRTPATPGRDWRQRKLASGALIRLTSPGLCRRLAAAEMRRDWEKPGA